MPKHLPQRAPRATTSTKPTPPPPAPAPPAVIIPPPPPDVPAAAPPAAAPPPKPAVKAAAPAAGLAQVLHNLLDAAPADLLTCLPLSPERIERYRAARRAAEAILRGGK